MRFLLGVWVLLLVAGVLGVIVAWIIALGRPPRPRSGGPIEVEHYAVSDPPEDGPYTEDVNPERDEELRAGDE